MNDDHLSSSHKYSQSQVNFRQPYLINCYTEQEQSEENRAINNNTNRAELDWLRTLYDSLPCIYFTLNSAGVILTVSQFGATYLGYGALELTQISIERVFFQDDRVHGEAMLMHLQQQPAQMSQWEARIIHKNGTPIWVKATAHLVPGTEFNPIISLVCEDITAHKQRSEALEESEERFRSIADSAPMLLWMSDADGLCTFFNQSWLNFTGRALEQEQGDGWTQGVHSEDLHDCLTTYLSALKAWHDFRMEYRLKQASGEYRWVLNTGIPRFTPNGSFVGYIGSCVDITDRKQAEEALRQQFLRERLIGAIAQRIHQSLNLEEILNTTVAEVRQLLACDRVVIFRLHKDGSGVVVVESVSSGWKHIAGTTINDRYFAEAYIQLYKYGRVQAVEDIYTASLTQCHVDLLARFQVRANLVVPIVHEEQLWGLLVAQQCSEPRKWQEWEIDLLKSLATQAAIAIHQSELYQQAQTEIVQRQQA
ncbi:MAG TPA: PAS domain S-box protein, partial [Coleofasciculaceae cyanobacterium]